MAQPNHHLQTVYPSDYKTQTKLSGWIIHKIMDQSQFDKAKKKEEHNKTSIQEKYVLKKRLLKIFKNKKKKTIPHTLHYTTLHIKLMVQQVTSCSLMAAPIMASSYFMTHNN